MASAACHTAIAKHGRCRPFWSVCRIVRRCLRGPFGRTSPVIVVLEGKHDVQFITRISAVLHAADGNLPDLRFMERQGQIVFLPCGGVDPQRWPFRLAPLACREFHLLDRDRPEDADARQLAASMVNLRAGCYAAITKKRAVENYLHPRAVCEAVGSRSNSPTRTTFLSSRLAPATNSKATASLGTPFRCVRKRYRNYVKGWLNGRAVDCMTADRLAERDPDGEVRGWLTTISELAPA